MSLQLHYILVTYLALSTPWPLAAAHGNGMDMGMDTGTSQAAGHMMPYLHFTLGDNLWFIGWVPESKGAMAGACIGLFLLAVVDRWISACRAVMEVHWSRRAQVLIVNKRNTSGSPSTPTKKPSISPLTSMRTAPPFIPAHDITRGILHIGQATLGFAFMLAVMTFQAGFILAIVLGLGVGETLFGRFANAAPHLH